MFGPHKLAAVVAWHLCKSTTFLIRV